MSETNFKVGDVVRLKSGGPAMTVYEIDKDMILCQWFPANNQPETSRFHAETLDVLK